MRGQMAEEERWTDTALFCLPAAAQHSETPHHHRFSHDLMVFSGFAPTWPIFSFNFSTHHGKCVASRFNTVLWPVYQLPDSRHRHSFKSFGTIVLPIGDDQKRLQIPSVHCIPMWDLWAFMAHRKERRSDGGGRDQAEVSLIPSQLQRVWPLTSEWRKTETDYFSIFFWASI